MLPKSSPRIAEVVRLANVIAREHEQEYVGTEHVLLAIFREGQGVGARVLAGRGATEKAIKQQIDKHVKKQMEDTWVFGRLPGTPHFKNVVATAIEQCQELGAKEVCTDHLLLALAKEDGCTAQKVLHALGLKFADLRKDVLALTGQAPASKKTK
ncbi:MAG: hypothetical protein J5J06_14080 [Phycisphaerae bacterium]|nr:hypothetical protein [Phycisphaerae bacterium]